MNANISSINGISSVVDALALDEQEQGPSSADGTNRSRPDMGAFCVGVVDDEPAHLDLLAHCMRSIGLVVTCFHSGEELIAYMRQASLDLLVVDWQLPGISGPEVVRWVRENSPNLIPIVLATNRVGVQDILEGFEAGADDYVTKPIRVLEMVARVRALLRRSTFGARDADELVVGSFILRKADRSVTLESGTVMLTDREFAFAHCVFSRVGCLLSRQYLVEAVWGGRLSDSSRAVDTLASIVRKKLELRAERGYKLMAVYGVGYRLERCEPGA